MRTFLNILIITLAMPVFAGASELRLEKSISSVRAGDTFIVDVSLNTHNEIVNALEGSLNFSSNLKLNSIRLSGSIVPLWVSPPKEKGAGAIEFAGVLPGGYQGTGNRGNVFTLVLEAQEKGPANISFGSETSVYKNDGNGTRDTLTANPIHFPVLAQSGPANTNVLPEDTTPPEPFIPLIMPGEPFGHPGSVIIFSTQDKDSGILRFDVARSYNRYAENNLSWQESRSPYALREEDADRYVFVRAVDYAGNTRIEIVPPQKWSLARFAYEWWLALVILMSAVILYTRAMRR